MTGSNVFSLNPSEQKKKCLIFNYPFMTTLRTVSSLSYTSTIDFLKKIKINSLQKHNTDTNKITMSF
jgi:hypothetical protein